MTAELAAIAEAYRWQRALGHPVIETPTCRIVAQPATPDIWDANHADSVTAADPQAIAATFAAIDRHLAHSDWRVVHTDCFTPDPFLARLAHAGFEERPLVVQMVLRGELAIRAGAGHRPVETDADWAALLALVRLDHQEGARTGHLAFEHGVTEGMVAGFRAKAPAFRFHLAIEDGAPVAYGALALAPNGVGMIEDLFTLPAYRRRGIASGMIAAFAEELRRNGAETIFLGALAQEKAKHLYAKLGFEPVMLARNWVRRALPIGAARA